MPDRKFAIVNDQSGETEDCTYDQFADKQAQGWRVADVAGYEAAKADVEMSSRIGTGAADMGKVEEERKRLDAQPMAKQTREDASETAEKTYPEAKPVAGDKPKTSKQDKAE